MYVSYTNISEMNHFVHSPTNPMTDLAATVRMTNSQASAIKQRLIYWDCNVGTLVQPHVEGQIPDNP